MFVLLNPKVMKKILLLFFCLMSSHLTIAQTYNPYSCAGFFCNTAKHYDHVQSQDKENLIYAYKFFIEKHKKGKLSVQANNELLKLIEDRDWENTIESNTIELYNKFMSLYRESKRNDIGFPEGSLERIMLINLYYSFSNVEKLKSVEDWELFILNYPEDCFICDTDSILEFAKNNLLVTKDYNDWEISENIGTSVSYQDYLSNHPDGWYKEDAIQRINILIVGPEWEKIKKKNMIVSYAEFIKKYPNSSYAKLADEAAWDKAVEKNRITYYKRYLENLPEGDHIQECMKKLMDLEIAYEESKGKYSGGLPTLNQNDEEYINSNEHVFTIINMTRDIGNKTPKTLLVSFRGHTDDGYVTGNYTIRIGDCMERIFAPGTYYFVIETKGDKSIEKYRNTEIWDFQGGSRTEELELGVFPLNHIQKPMTQEETLKLYKKYLKCFSKDIQEIIKSYE